MLLAWGAVLGAAVSAYGAYRARKRAEQYATEMSNTAHQREVRDLRAAGLNPILSAGGRGASTPTIQPAEYGRSPAVGAQVQLASAQSAKLLAEARLIKARTPRAEVVATPWKWGQKAIKWGEEHGAEFVSEHLPQARAMTRDFLDAYGPHSAKSARQAPWTLDAPAGRRTGPDSWKPHAIPQDRGAPGERPQRYKAESWSAYQARMENRRRFKLQKSH